VTDYQIYQAMLTRLATITPALATVEENEDYTPITGTRYQEAYLLPAQPENITLGDAYYRNIGIFQVTLRFPINQGNQPLEVRAQKVIDAFPRALGLTFEGKTVRVMRTPSKSPSTRIDDRYVCAISIPYMAEVFPA
jgi:hypothetical protein